MNMDKKEIWTKYFVTLPIDKKRKVKNMDYRFLMTDCTGSVHVTDLMFQLGRMANGYIPANKELLKRDRDSQENVIRTKHYNGVIRGKRTIAVPNRARVSEEKDLSKRVTGGIDFYLSTTQATSTNGVQFAHQYGQREMIIHPVLGRDEQVVCSATKRQVIINGSRTQEYTGKFHTCPAGFGIYHLSLSNEKGEWHGSGMLRCEVDMWLKGLGGERM